MPDIKNVTVSEVNGAIYTQIVKECSVSLCEDENGYPHSAIIEIVVGGRLFYVSTKLPYKEHMDELNAAREWLSKDHAERAGE